MSEIDEIKDRLDIVELVSESVQLKRTGKNYTGFCPFHSNTRTPSFVVFPDTGTWRCFGQCNDGGDVFSFVMKKEGWDFAEALRALAERAGVELKPLTPQQQEAAEEHDNLRALLEEAVTFFRHHLMNTSAGKAALGYLTEKRQLSEATIEGFGLGYAPDAWEALTSHFSLEGHLGGGPAGLRAGLRAGQRRGVRPLPPPDHLPHPGRARAHGRVRGAGPQPGGRAQVPELSPNRLVRQEQPAVRPGPGRASRSASKTRP